MVGAATEVAEGPELSVREAAFVNAYLADSSNASEAARQAGYKDGSGLAVTASRLLTRPNVVAELERRRTIVATQTDYSVASWLSDLRARTDSAFSAGNHSAGMKGMELLGRHIGALNDSRPRSQMEVSFWETLEKLAGSAAATQAAGRLASHADTRTRASLEDAGGAEDADGREGGAG